MLHLKRGGGGADSGDEAVLHFVGLGEFARLNLPDHPPDELGFAASYDEASGCIMVSVCGVGVAASPADLAGALGLPMGPVGLPTGLGAAVFRTEEAIGAVKGVVCNRVLLGLGGSGVAGSMEIAAALQLVEQGMAYNVDWGRLIWAVVKGEVVAGRPWRFAPYLLRLMVCQRPELFAESLPLGKRFKDQVLQQYLLAGEEATSLDFLGTQNIGDLEEMPIFGSQTSSHFQDCMNQIQAYVSDMNSRYQDKEQSCRDTQHEVECIRNMVMEKEKQIEAIVMGIQQELLAKIVEKQKFEADKDQLRRSIQHYDKLLKKSLAKFQEYMNIAGLNQERLNNFRSIPDLNNGLEDDGEGKAYLATTLGAAWTGEGDRVSNTTQGGKQLVELTGNPDKRNDNRESMDLDGTESGTKLC